ncbi:MAG TPA: hypothetical protein VFI12_09755, partial [Thermomicrobiales bacterium]|nr:hypothetical protein [Thermomicrobiales bacterium]
MLAADMDQVEMQSGTAVLDDNREMDSGAPISISAAVEIFFGDLRLAPRSKKTYRNGIAKFVRHLA